MNKLVQALMVALLPVVVLTVFNTKMNAQDAKDPVLFSFNGVDVKKSEFLYVYNKNNANDKDKYTLSSLEEYLELYINFRLKVHEAEKMGMDTISSLKEELAGYRKQLSKSFLFDREVNEKLIKEAYERMKTDVRASHILINIEEPGLPSDTVKAYKEAMKVRQRLLNGEDFEKVAKQVSDDPSASNNGGDVGWFTAFNTIYPFETAAYNAKIGEITMPVRTKFGYHIIKVTDRRPARGKVRAAHILISIPKNATEKQKQQAESEAFEVYEMATNGKDFGELAKLYSDDKFSSAKGGTLPEFGSNSNYVDEFKEAAFSLDKKGAISKPVKTAYGWHVIKLLDKVGLPSFEEAKPELKKRTERDSRSEMAKHELVKRVKEDYGFTEYTGNVRTLYKDIGGELTKGKFVMQNKEGLDEPLFELAGITYTQGDFVNFLEENQKKKRSEPAEKIYYELYNKFVENTCLSYEETQLEDKYPEFKALMREYRDGILLFALTDEKVWSKAVEDTAGLEAFYETVKHKYMYKKRVDADIYSSTNEKYVKKARKMAKKGKFSTQEILDKFNTEEEKMNLLVQSGKFEPGDNPRIEEYLDEWEAGVTDIFLHGTDNNIYGFIHVKQVLEPMPKELNKVKGFVVSEYQEKLERDWIKSLRGKYDVNVNKGVLKLMAK